MFGRTRNVYMSNIARLIIGLLLSISTAVLFALAFPPFGWWPLIFVGLVPMLLAQHRIMPSKLSGLASGIGIGGFFYGYFGSMFTGAIWFMKCLPLIIGIIAALASSRERAFHQRTDYKWFVPMGIFVWVGIEAIRGLIPVVGTWGFVGYALFEQSWLIQPVSIFGIYGLDMLVIFANYSVAYGLLSWFDARWCLDISISPITIGSAWIVIFMVFGALWVGGSYMMLESPEASLTVAAIQRPRATPEEELVRLTKEASSSGAQLIVWPEGALFYDPHEVNTDKWKALVRETDSYLLMGYTFYDENRGGRINEVTLLSPYGEFLGTYGKDHPVAYIGETSITGGAHPAFETEYGAVGAVICYDADFTDSVRKVVHNGAKLVTVSSNDWSAIAHLHYTHTVFRAVENRVSMVRADGGYDSVIVDPYGRILERKVVTTTSPESAVLIAKVPLGSGKTVSSGWGDWMGWLCIIGMAFFVVLILITTGRERRRGRLRMRI